MSDEKKSPKEARIPVSHVPPLTYVGSKWKLAQWIIDHMPPHEVYVEPYAGSAAVFFRKHPSPLEVINDLDERLVNFFRVLREQPEELIRQIVLTPWARQEREVFLVINPEASPVERARQYYVLLKQSFAGNVRGNNGWRRNTSAKSYTSFVEAWHRYEGLNMASLRLLEAQIECLPAVQCIADYDSASTLFYVDPPYVLDTRSGGHKRYAFEMSDDEHRELAKALHAAEGMVMLSGYHSALYDELYADWQTVEAVNYADQVREAVEVLWLSPSLQNAEFPLFRGLSDE